MYNYKSLIEEFCEYSKNASNYLLKKEIYSLDLFNLTNKEYIDLLVNIMFGKSKSIKHLRTNHSYLNLFFKWCVDKEIITTNPLEENEELSVRSIMFLASENSGAKMIYPENIQYFIRNSTTRGLIVRLLFDGVSTLKELVRIKISDIDFENETIYLEQQNRTINVSTETIQTIQKYMNDNIRIRDGKTFDVVKYKDYLVKYIAYKGIRSDEAYFKGAYTSLSNFIISHLNISVLDISRSGFICSLREELSYLSNKEFCDIFIMGNMRFSKKTGEIIYKVMNDYGIKVNRGVMLENCIPYILSSKYYHD